MTVFLFGNNQQVIGKIQSAIGKTRLLVNKKFEQFRDLCKKNLQEKIDELTSNKTMEFRTLDDDLAGFWDMLCIQIDDVRKYFSELDTLRDNGWIQVNKIKNAKSPSTTSVRTKQTTKIHNATNGNQTQAGSTRTADESRKRIIEAKRNAMLKQQQEQQQSSLSTDDTDVVFF